MGFDKRGRIAFGIAMLLLVITLSSVALSLASDGTITIGIGYANSPGIDENNDGIESFEGAIDFTAESTQFSWQANESNLCTLWRILPDNSSTATLVCYGASHCCNFADLGSSAESWSDIFYLFPGAYGVASRADISAKVVYVDYQIVLGNITSDIQFSDWATLYAEFTNGSSNPQITVISPSNSTSLNTGELALAAQFGGSASLLYSLDGAANATAQGNITASQSNYTASLQGSLPTGVIGNGIHMLRLYTNTGLSLEHPFVVADYIAPQINCNIANNSIINVSGSSYNVALQASEISDIFYSLNSGSTVLASTATKATNFTITPAYGQNSLTITAEDMQGNIKSYHYNFTYIQYGQGSCQDTVQNFHDGMNETGIDCGGPCSQCVMFNATLDKQQYIPGEIVFIDVQARPDAMHNITITGPGFRASYTYNGSTYYVISPSSLGNYTVNISLKYKNLSPEYIIRKFSLISNEVLTIAIGANATEIIKNEAVAFSAAITGNKSTVSIKWDFNGDNLTDSTSRLVNYTYAAAGTYVVKLNVSDSDSSRLAVASITVRPFYNITINATDRNQAAISSAVIELNGEKKSITPTSQFSIPPKSYDLVISAPGYINKTASITISENSTLSYTLYRDDPHAPLITLVSPEDNVTSTKSAVDLVFRVSDDTQANCTLLLYNSSRWLRLQSLVATAEHKFSLELGPGAYIWKVECTDEGDNINTSEMRVYTVSAGLTSDLTAASASERVDQIIMRINDAITAIDDYGKVEQEAATTLQLKDALEKAKTELQRAVRDISNIKWRRLNASEEGAFIDEALNRISAIESNITTGITVIKSAKFVSYPDDAGIKEAAQAYLTWQLKQPAKTELDNYISENKGIQQGTIITTDYKVLELKTLSGAYKTITLLEKSVKYSGNMTDLLVVEVMPKTSINSANELTALFDYEVIKEDPVIRVELPENNAYAYYVESELTQVQAQAIQTVLLTKSLKLASKAPTGLAVLSLQGFKDPKIRFIIEVVIAIILLGVYITYSRGLLKFSRQSKEMKSLKALLEEIRAAMQQNNYDKSKELYKGIQQSFKQLKPDEKKHVYGEVAGLYHELDAKYVKKRIDEANVLLAHNQRAEALSVYSELTRVYKNLPQQYKQEIYSGCMELHKKLGAQK
jgi:PKD repeat protein